MIADIACIYPDDKTGKKLFVPSSTPSCMGEIAKGLQGLSESGDMQGHMDAEAFMIYAMGE